MFLIFLGAHAWRCHRPRYPGPEQSQHPFRFAPALEAGQCARPAAAHRRGASPGVVLERASMPTSQPVS